MTRIALKILFGNPGKYLSMVLGVAFASLLICQQALIFCGLMRMAASQIQDTGGAEIWVMDPNAQFIDDNLPMRDRELSRVRGVDGVRWAVRIDKGQSRAKLMRAGEFQQLIVLGLNDTTLVGGPQDVSGLQGACSQVWPRRWASVCSDVVAPAARLKVWLNVFTSSHQPSPGQRIVATQESPADTLLHPMNHQNLFRHNHSLPRAQASELLRLPPASRRCCVFLSSCCRSEPGFRRRGSPILRRSTTPRNRREVQRRQKCDLQARRTF